MCFRWKTQLLQQLQFLLLITAAIVGGVAHAATPLFKVVSESSDTVNIPGSGPVITTPVNGTVLENGTPTFIWSTGQPISYYWLYVGSAAGAANHFNSGPLPGTQLSVEAAAPTDSSTVYVTLHYYTGGVWASITAEYTASTPITVFTLLTPTAGQHLLGTTLDVS